MSPSSGSRPLEDDATVHGTVSDEAGRAVAGALLELEALDGQPNPQIESLRQTGADGRYQLALAPGRWRVAVSADGYAIAEVDLDVPRQGRMTRDITLSAL